MKHFPEQEWIDFVGKVIRTIRMERMKQDLEQACKQCSELVSPWQRVPQTPEAEPDYKPPPDAVRIANAPFASSNSTGERENRGGLAKLHFDSLLQPILKGARLSSIGTRQMLYRSGSFQIDLLIESRAGGRRVGVIGQLLDLHAPGIVGHDLRVTLSNRRGCVVQALTNQFGEFCDEIENSGSLELKFLGANHKPMVISLRDERGA